MDEGEGPSNVKDLLAEAKDVSELMVDLAYAAVFFNDEKLAEGGREAPARAGRGTCGSSAQVAMLAARSPEDAEKMGDVLHIAGGHGEDRRRRLRHRAGRAGAARHPARRSGRISATPTRSSGGSGSAKERRVVGRSLRDLRLPGETGMWLMAIRRRRRVGVRPRRGHRALRRATCCCIQGPEEGVNLIRELVGAPAATRPARARGPGADRAGSRRRHPGRDEELRRGRRRAGLLGLLLQEPGAGRGGRLARGAVGHPARRDGVLGAEGGSRGDRHRRAARAAPAGVTPAR